MFQQLIFQMAYNCPERELLAAYDQHLLAIAQSGGNIKTYSHYIVYLMVSEAIYHRGLSDSWKPMTIPS